MDALAKLDWDVHRFSAYVRRILLEGVKREPTEDEVADRDSSRDSFGHGQHVDPFIQKSFHLLHPIIDRGLGEAALRILVLLETTLRKSNPRVSHLGPHIGSNIQSYVSSKQATMIALNKRVHDEKDQAFVYSYRNQSGGLRWENSMPNQSL